MGMVDNNENSGSTESALDSQSDVAVGLFESLTKDLVCNERQERRAAFRNLRSEVERVSTFQVNAGRRPQSYHKLYIEDPNGLYIERRAFFGIVGFPGFGDINRLIVNDESSTFDDHGTRKLAVSDYVFSLVSNTFTLQRTELARTDEDRAWHLSPSSGPIIQPRVDRVELIHGKSYAMNLPKVGGWPTPLSESIVNRFEIQNAVAVLGSLSVGSYEPGYSNEVGF